MRLSAPIRDSRTMSRFVRPLLILLLLPFAAAGNAAAGGGLSRLERRAAAVVDRNAPAALALLERAVDINSGSMNFEGMRAVPPRLRFWSR